MNKILAVVRASTEQQQVESQQAELKEFCEKLGYNDIEWIEVSGASARKANKKYLEMLENIKNTIIAKDIKVVALESTWQKGIIHNQYERMVRN